MDKRCALRSDYLLALEGRKYRLQGKYVAGGSSLVYKARLENDITNDFYMIKEFYPIEFADDIVRMPDGSLQFPAGKLEAINARKERARRESTIVDKLRHGEDNTNNNPWFLSYSKLIEANNTLYTVIATESGEVLSDRIDSGYFNDKGFEDICDCMLRILDALEPLHKKGYLHLDISPDNIHFSDTKIARLIDFNSAYQVGEPFERLNISFKEGYSAKELVRRTTMPPTISYATDLFSVAAILFEILMGRPQGDDDRLPGIRHLSSERGYLASASELLVSKVNDFLTKGIAHTQRKRFQSVHEMREAVEELKRLKIEIDLVNAPNRVKPSQYFVYRESGLRQIGEVLERDNFAFLEGIGGIGKTELAKSYAREKDYDIVQLVNFGRNLQEAIAYNLQFHNFNVAEYEAKFGENAVKYIFQDKVNRLVKCAENGQRILIIIDNYSDTSQADFKLFTSGQYHVIFTTREKLDGIEIAPMDEESLLKMFCKYYAPCVLTDEETPVIREIIETVSGHTMTVMLAASAMQKSSIKPSEMLKQLQGNHDSDTKLKIDKEWLGNDKREQAMMQHIFTLFDMTRIKKDTTFSHIMVNMVIAPESGLIKEEFYQLALRKLYNNHINFVDLNWLIGLRWVHEHYDDDCPYISLHAVIADVASRELKPNTDNCGEFITGLLMSAHGDTQVEASAAANRIKTACKRINDETVLARDLFYRYARLSSFLADYPSALKYYEKVAVITENNLGAESPITASTYNNIAMIYHKSGDCDEALKWYEKAIDALMIVPDDKLHALLYNNIAAINNTKGDYALALICYEKALEIYEAMHGCEHADTAMAVNNIACTYLHQRDYDQAKVWFQKAVKLREKVHGKEHPATATTYGNIALGCCYQGKYKRALEWEQRALKIRENVLGNEHPETAISYNNIGLIYACQGDKVEARGWYQKAYAINEKMLGKEHPKTVETYRNISYLDVT